MPSRKSQAGKRDAGGPVQKAGHKILGVIAREDAEKLLLDLANAFDLPDAPHPFALNNDYFEEEQYPAYRRLITQHASVFGAIDDFDTYVVHKLRQFRDRLRQAWTERDPRCRDWRVYQLRLDFHRFRTNQQEKAARKANFPMTTAQLWEQEQARLQGRIEPREDYHQILEDPPPLTKFEATMFYFQAIIADRARFCEGPDCKARYFIAVKRWQKYCSLECAGPAGREAKRKWWHEHKGKGSSL
jgi:hypothetical protein